MLLSCYNEEEKEFHYELFQLWYKENNTFMKEYSSRGTLNDFSSQKDKNHDFNAFPLSSLYDLIQKDKKIGDFHGDVNALKSGEWIKMRSLRTGRLGTFDVDSHPMSLQYCRNNDYVLFMVNPLSETPLLSEQYGKTWKNGETRFLFASYHEKIDSKDFEKPERYQFDIDFFSNNTNNKFIWSYVYMFCFLFFISFLMQKQFYRKCESFILGKSNFTKFK